MGTAIRPTPGQTWIWACALALSLSACGGGGGDLAQDTNGGDPTPAPVDPTPFDPAATVALLSAAEDPAVADPPSTYSVQDDSTVLQGTVYTKDTATTTFANVNDDINDADALVPEIPAHIQLPGLTAAFDPILQTMNATIRLRGHSSRLAPQKSYRIKLTGSNFWRAEQTLQFNKHPWDLTRVRNKLAMDLFRTIPHMPSLRTQFVRLDFTVLKADGTLNDPTAPAVQDFGLFTHVEKMGKEYLANRGLPAATATIGNIYKAEDFSFRPDVALALTGTGAADKAIFETVLSLEADNKDHTKLIAMINAVSDESTDFDAVFAQYFDRANYLTWLATSILMGNRDTINQNFALYQPKGTDKFFFLPWDYDGSFSWEGQPDVVAGGSSYPAWQLSVGNWWNVPLHRRFIKLHLNEVKAAVDHIYATYLTQDKLDALLTAYRPLVRPRVSVAPDVNSLPTTSGGGMAQWDAEYARIKTATTLNKALFQTGLEAPMPFFTALNLVGGNHRVSWDAAEDLQGDVVSYTVEISTTPTFGTTVQPAVTLTGVTEWQLPSRLSDGTYYLRVTARERDTTAHRTQQAFDRVTVNNVRYNGVLGVVVSSGNVTPI